ncbi:MAG: hypothetical protein AAB879_03860 [Patescibacteria group bacterium]|mgnify:CR=1 FL=1
MHERINPFSIRPEAVAPTHIAVDRLPRTRRRERANRTLEHIATVPDLHDYLEGHGHLDACEHVFFCDPWTYEPILLDDLTHELEKGVRSDHERIARLRKLIRAGSWMTAPRLRSEEVLRVLADVRAGEREMWESRIRHADPDTSKEHRECFKEEMGGFDLMADAIESKSVGENVENATLAMDDLQRRLWASLTSVLTARNLTLLSTMVTAEELTR